MVKRKRVEKERNMFNNRALAAIISDYKQNFEQIHKEEIYKWKAVKCFQVPQSEVLHYLIGQMMEPRAEGE